MQKDNYMYWIFVFYLLCVIGWVLECTIESVSHKRLINRGFLHGPYIPIYGVGGVLFAIIGIPLKNAFDNTAINVILVYFVGMCSATMLEYMVGSILEKIFKKQFWDFSKLKITSRFTYKNRISLVSSLFWGVCSVFMTFFLYERIDKLMVSLSPRFISITIIIATIIMGIDLIITIRKQENVRAMLDKLSYEQIKETLFKTILKTGNSYQIREFGNNILKNIHSINENIKQSVDDNIESIKSSINDNIDNFKKNISSSESLESFKTSLNENIDNLKKSLNENLNRFKSNKVIDDISDNTIVSIESKDSNDSNDSNENEKEN